MKAYKLFTGTIEGHRNVRIFPIEDTAGAYLIHWDDFEVGIIKNMDGKWYTNEPELIAVTNELGNFINSNM